MPQKQAKSAAGARGERQTAHRRQIDSRLVIIEFRDDDGDRGTFQRLFHRPKRIGGARHFKHDQSIHRKPKAIETGAIGRAGFRAYERTLYPEHLPALPSRQRRKCERKSRCSSSMQRNCRREFMQRAKRKPAAEHLIDGSDAESQHGSLHRLPGGLDSYERLTQMAQRFHGWNGGHELPDVHVMFY